MVSVRPTSRLICVVALLAAGCASGPAEPPAGFPYASAMRECGPADGPAVTIYLRRDSMPALPPGGPYVRVHLWHGLEELRGRSWDVGGASVDGFADYNLGGDAATALRGTVTVTAVRADSTVEGEVDLTVPAGTGFAVRGGFKARWVSRELLCG